jgi:hypothetical protein
MIMCVKSDKNQSNTLVLKKMSFGSLAEILVGVLILASLFYVIPKYLSFLDLPLMYKAAISVVPAGLIWHGLHSFGAKAVEEKFSEETGELHTQPEMSMEAQQQPPQESTESAPIPHESAE